GPAVGVAGGAVLVQFGAALVAKAGAQVVLAAAAMAAVGQLTAGHGHERPLGALDDLQVADDEGVVERDRAEGLETFVVVFHKLDADFGDNHSSSPLICGTFWGPCHQPPPPSTGRIRSGPPTTTSDQGT